MALVYKFTIHPAPYEVVYMLMEEWGMESHKQVIKGVLLAAAEDEDTVELAIEWALKRQKVMRGE